MREAFLSLTPADRIEALAVAASRGGRPPHILEKDVWVVWALAQLFDSPFGCSRRDDFLPGMMLAITRTCSGIQPRAPSAVSKEM